MTPAKKQLSKWAKAALKGCDWFVNSQRIQQRPNWDANHGRFQYNVHVGTDTACMGIGWTQARAIFCLLPAYKLTGDKKYLESAQAGIDYIKTLQNMDRRYPKIYGTFHEMTPHSRFAYPRDAIEVADALIQWWKITRDKDALERAELFFDWFWKNAVFTYPCFGKWVHGDVQFDKKSREFKGPISCEMGSGTILAHAFKATGKARYKTLCKQLSDSILKNYESDRGVFTEKAKGTLANHTDVSGLILNDDGGCVSLMNTYKITGQKKYRDAALANAVYYRDRKEPIAMYSGTASAANILIETFKLTKDDSFRKASERYTRELIKLQVKSGSKMVRGGFRGEDEGGHWYVKGAKNDELVTTRVTAYAVLTLFKLDGTVKAPGYSIDF